jgi:lysophospholipase L1-like esterase
MLKKTALALAGVIVCLLLGEIVVRLAHLAPGVNRIRVDLAYGTFESSTNAVLRYVPSPGSRDISGYGLRDRDYPRAKPRGTKRILVIGDSVGYGFCNDREVLTVDSLFPKQLERGLAQAAAAPVEVINLCVSGYDTVQEVEFLVQKGLALDPDIVLVAYCLNDDFDASAELQKFQSNPQFALESVIGQHLVLRSHLARLIWLRHAQPRTATKATPGTSRTERGFERLATLAREHDFQPVVVVFPLFEPLASYRWHAQHAQAAQLAARYGLPVLDLLEAFAAAGDGDLRNLQGRCNREHPDEQGHRVAAREIQSYLFQHSGLEGRPGTTAGDGRGPE